MAGLPYIVCVQSWLTLLTGDGWPAIYGVCIQSWMTLHTGDGWPAIYGVCSVLADPAHR